MLDQGEENMARHFEGKVALVTGGGSGIGQATALLFAREGAKVVIADVLIDGMEATASRIQDAGGEALCIRVDVSKDEEVAAMVAKTVETYGQLDCAYNNAGIFGTFRGPMHEWSEEVWNQVMGINLKGVWLCMKYEIIQMLRQGCGAIVNTASIAGLVGIQGNAAYGASKHGVVGLTKTAALDYARAGLRINAVCPGYIDTPLTARALHVPERRKQLIAREPMGRIGSPEEVAQAVMWLCSDAAAFVTGHTMAVDGGYVAQ